MQLLLLTAAHANTTDSGDLTQRTPLLPRSIDCYDSAGGLSRVPNGTGTGLGGEGTRDGQT